MSKTSSLSERLRSLSEDMTIDLTETTVKYTLPIQKNTSHQKNDGDETKQQGAQQRKSLSKQQRYYYVVQKTKTFRLST